MKKNRYKDVFDEIHVPETLKKKTIALMEQEEPERKRSLFSLKILIPALGVCVIAIVVLLQPGFLNLTGDTASKDNINFEDSFGMDNSLQLSPINEKGTLSKANEFFGFEVVYPKMMNIYERTDMVNIFKSDEKVTGMAVTTSFVDEDKVMYVQYLKTTEKEMETNSTIQGIDMLLREHENTYQIEFIHNGAKFSISATNVSEDDVVSFLKGIKFQ